MRIISNSIVIVAALFSIVWMWRLKLNQHWGNVMLEHCCYSLRVDCQQLRSTNTFILLFSVKISFCLNKTIIAYVSSIIFSINRSVAFCINRFHRCVLANCVASVLVLGLFGNLYFDVLSYRYVHTLKFLLIRTKY